MYIAASSAGENQMIILESIQIPKPSKIISHYSVNYKASIFKNSKNISSIVVSHPSKYSPLKMSMLSAINTSKEINH
jgi:hypothetical protein